MVDVKYRDANITKKILSEIDDINKFIKKSVCCRTVFRRISGCHAPHRLHGRVVIRRSDYRLRYGEQLETKETALNPGRIHL